MTRNNGARIFLTELMFSILFFIIIAAVCVQCFATSVTMSRQAKETSEAVNVASNQAELFLGGVTESDFSIYYDSDWKEVIDQSQAVYMATGLISESGDLEVMDITVTATESDLSLYTLEVEKAQGLED